MWTNVPPKYESVDLNETVVEDITRRSEQRRRHQLWRKWLGASLVIATLAALAIYTTVQHWRATPELSTLARFPCGRSASDARAANCTFDVMMDEWLPESCLDRELLQEFKSLQEWSFWADENRTIPLSEEGLSERYVAYTTLEYHIAHCSFALRKFHRALAKGGQIEAAVASVEHTTHCAELHRQTIETLQQSNAGEGEAFSIFQLGTPLHPGFPRCIDTRKLVPQ